ncbi:DNA-3-methyladenine glycosylase I [bacterium]|nr:DNA-3-methyladenine glycosylase I [FCB group bacterium]MBL7190541.1 DNA-3-methyladenine glycosylase I [bacterium]
MKEFYRCAWAQGNPLLERYHDTEWGVPNHDDAVHFEHLVLETFQAGLNWLTMLKKRENFRRALDNLDPVKIADYGEADFKRLMNDSGIIRNRQKIKAIINNAQKFLEVVENEGGYDNFVWRFQPEKTIVYHRDDDIPAITSEAEEMSKELKSRGFSFAGPTICYAFMQGVGIVNDHTAECFRFQEIEAGK